MLSLKNRFLVGLFIVLVLTTCSNELVIEVPGGVCDPYWDYTILGWIQEEGKEKLLFLYSYLTEDIPQNATDSEKGKYYDTQYYTVNRDGTDLKTRPEFKELMSGKGYLKVGLNPDKKSFLVGQLEELSKDLNPEEKAFKKIYKMLSINLINKTVTDLNFKASRNELSRMQLSPDGKFLIYSPDRKTEKEEDRFQLVNTQTGEEKKIELTVDKKDRNLYELYRINLINITTINNKISAEVYYNMKNPENQVTYICSYGTINTQDSQLELIRIYQQTPLESIKDSVTCSLIGGYNNKVLYVGYKVENKQVIAIFEHNIDTNEIKQIATLPKQKTYYTSGLSRRYFTHDLQQVVPAYGSGIAISNIDGSNQHTLVSLKQLPRKGVNVPECLQLSFP